jgi:hypothetical protein
MVGPTFMNVVIEGTLRPNTGFQAKINESGMTSTAIKDPLTLEGKCIGLYSMAKPQICRPLRGSRIARTNSMKLYDQD